MKVIGFSQRSFTSKDTGELIEGVFIYVSYENKCTTGCACERLYVSLSRLDQCDYYPSVGDDIEPLYNRYGKITGIRLLDKASS